LYVSVGDSQKSQIYDNSAGVFVSTDGGNTFQLSNDRVVRFFNDNGSIYGIGGYYSYGFYKTSDGGLTYSFWDAIYEMNTYVRNINDIHASGNVVYVATAGTGFYQSNDWGESFVNISSSCGFTDYYSIVASGTSIYAASDFGLCVSKDSGATWSMKTPADGLGGRFVRKVYEYGNVLYVAIDGCNWSGCNYPGGLSISTDGGMTFTNYTENDGLVSSSINDILYVP
jgi:photosystem II stability/assembly factor-like uncharacterized protein